MDAGNGAAGWFAGLGCPALLLEPSTGNALLGTAGLGELLGCPQQEASRRGLELLDQGSSPYDLAELHRHVRLAAQGQAQFLSWPRLKPQGTRPWLELEFRRIDEDGPGNVVLYLNDVSAQQRLLQDRKKIQRALAKRVAELECLYKLFAVFETKGLPLETMYRNTLDGIIEGWSWPEAACVRLTLSGSIYQTDNFRETPWRLTAPVKGEEQLFGSLEVGYLESRPSADEGPFLMEEKELLEAVAGRLGRIIERRHARDELRGERDFARSLLETTQAAVLVLDTRGRVLHCNQFTEALLGQSLAEIKGCDFFGHFVPDSQREQARRDLMQNPSGPNAAPCVFSVLDNGGRRLQVEWRTRPLNGGPESDRGVLCTGQDLTQRLNMEARLKRLAAAVEQAAEAIVITDAQGIITYVNPAYERLSGYKSEEAKGKSSRPASWTPTALEAALTHLAQGKVWEGRLELAKKNRDVYTAECAVSPIREADGQVTAYVAHLRDITMDLRLQEHLRQSQKMEAMGTLAGGIAHDFNNILGAIIGYAELAKMNVERPGQYGGYLDLSLRACQRAKDLVRQILTFSRQAEQEKKPVDMALLIKESLKLLRATLPTTVEMSLQLHLPTAPVLADPTQLHQVVMNLCTNAAHAMREKGGRLEVGLRALDLAAADLGQYPGLNPGPHLKLSVSDSGHGMTPVVAARIFDPFFTTKAPGEGTGLGLAVVHGIVTGCGGTIRVYSEPGHGTTFHVMLPMLAQAGPEQQKEQGEPPRGQEHILLVDDEDALVEIMTRVLKDLGYRVSAFLCPLEALKAFQARPLDFDLVLSDLTMPNMTGMELAKEVAGLRPGLPFLLCTGFSENFTAERAKAVGVREVVLKPILRQPLARAIRQALETDPNPGADDTP